MDSDTRVKRRRFATAAYWTTTGLISLAFAAGGIADLVQPPSVVAQMTHLGYPSYFTTILGFWKLLGAAAIIAPQLPRLKEWAYAGMFFDLTGASASHAAVGDGIDGIGFPLMLLAVTAASWSLRPRSRVLGWDKSRPASLAAGLHSAANRQSKVVAAEEINGAS